MKTRYIIAFKETGEVIKKAVRCQERNGELTPSERKKLGEYNEILYFDTIDNLMRYIAEHPKRFGG
jgi:hypothetical protein